MSISEKIAPPADSMEEVKTIVIDKLDVKREEGQQERKQTLSDSEKMEMHEITSCKLNKNGRNLPIRVKSIFCSMLLFFMFIFKKKPLTSTRIRKVIVLRK